MRGSSKCWLLIGMMAWGALAAQDIHFSQVDADPVLLNPAYSGFYQGAGRFGLIYRNQWASVSVPYQTFAVTGEMALWRSSNQRNGLSAGLLPLLLGHLQLCFEFLLLVSVVGCALKVLCLDSFELIFLSLSDASLQVFNFFWGINPCDVYT